ncbi:NUDIX hydrolase [bacterium]|nr:NUDIX hydrolase [bacterium]
MPGKTYKYEYPRPMVTADAILFTLIKKIPRVLLIRRLHEPFEGQWAFPGGFANEGETLLQAAQRELCEETSVEIPTLRPCDVFDTPGRDPRGWCISFAFYTVVAPDAIKPKANDDAGEVRWQRALKPPQLAFDHRLILTQGLARLRRDLYQTDVARPLLPEWFSSRTLEHLCATFDPNAPPAAKIISRLREAGVITRKGSPARYRFVDSP